MANPRASCLRVWRTFSLLLLATTVTLAADAPQAPYSRLGTSYDVASDIKVYEFEEKVWVFIATKDLEQWGPVPSNGLIVAGDDEVWILDTPWNDQLTAQLFDWVEANIGAITGVVATHFHSDRLGGIAEAQRRGIATWGHVETARLAPSVKLLPPERTFETSLDLSVGGETFELFYPGPGHTRDNVVVWFPERELLYGGCLIKSAGARSAGNLEDADLRAWPSSLEAIAKRYKVIRTVVPGHGAPGSFELLEQTSALVKKASATD